MVNTPDVNKRTAAPRTKSACLHLFLWTLVGFSVIIVCLLVLIFLKLAPQGRLPGVAAVGLRKSRLQHHIQGAGRDDNPAAQTERTNISRVLLIIHSGAMHSQKARQAQRDVCWPLYKKRTNVDMRFAIGVPLTTAPNPKSHNQGVRANVDEQTASQQLLNESALFNDLLFTPNRDMYTDLTLKVISYLSWGVGQGRYDYIVKTDDEYCLDTVTFDALLKREHQHEYFGWYFWKGDEYSIMKGPNNIVAPFMSGAVFGLSADLASRIIMDDAAHTNTYLSYGTSSDDANVGKWVQYAAATHGLDVKYIHNSKLLWCPKGPLKKGGRLACKIETLKTVSEED